MILNFKDKISLDSILNYISREVNLFNKGNRTKWKQTFLGAFDLTNDSLFVDFINENKLVNLINKITNQEYLLADAKLRMWTPRDPYLSWHRDTSIEKNGKIIGKIPPDINIFFYPKLNYKNSHQLHVVEKSHRQIFNNKIIKICRFYLAKELQNLMMTNPLYFSIVQFFMVYQKIRIICLEN